MTEAAYAGIDNLEVMKEAERYNRYLASLIAAELAPHDKVLDFGAGAGTFALPLIRQGVDVVCVEPDASLGAALRRAGARAVPSLDAVPANSIDLVYTFNVLEHIDDDGAAVCALVDKLKSRGRLLVYVPAFPLLFSAMDRKVGHRRRYRRRQLAELLTGAGLHLVEIAHVDSIGFAASLLYKVAPGTDGQPSPLAIKAYDRLLFPLSRVLDRLCYRWIGKNLRAVAVKPGAI